MKRYYPESIVNDEDKSKAIFDAIKLTIKKFKYKDYLSAVEASIGKAVFDYAIMFIPNEGLFSLIIEEDQRLSGYFIAQRINKSIYCWTFDITILLGMIERFHGCLSIENELKNIISLSRELSDKFKISLQRIAGFGAINSSCYEISMTKWLSRWIMVPPQVHIVSSRN